MTIELSWRQTRNLSALCLLAATLSLLPFCRWLEPRSPQARAASTTEAFPIQSGTTALGTSGTGWVDVPGATNLGGVFSIICWDNEGSGGGFFSYDGGQHINGRIRPNSPNNDPNVHLDPGSHLCFERDPNFSTDITGLYVTGH